MPKYFKNWLPADFNLKEEVQDAHDRIVRTPSGISRLEPLEMEPAKLIEVLDNAGMPVIPVLQPRAGRTLYPHAITCRACGVEIVLCEDEAQEILSGHSADNVICRRCTCARCISPGDWNRMIHYFLGYLPKI